MRKISKGSNKELPLNNTEQSAFTIEGKLHKILLFKFSKTPAALQLRIYIISGFIEIPLYWPF